MTDTQDTTNSRIDVDRPAPEASPSAGWRETAELMHVTAGREECDVVGCHREGEQFDVFVDDPGTVNTDAEGDTVDDAADTDDLLREGVRCSDHAKDFLEVSS
jgi:hypothetical protein